MIRRGESGWVDVRALMVARWWGCARVAPQVSTGNRTRATIKALPATLHHPRPYGLTSTSPKNLPVKAPPPPLREGESP